MKTNLRTIGIVLMTLGISVWMLHSQAQTGIENPLRCPGKADQITQIQPNNRSGLQEDFIINQNVTDFQNTTLLSGTIDTVWTRVFGGTGKDDIYSVTQTADGGYIMAGKTESTGAGNFDGWLIKLNADGVLSWSKTFGDSYIDEIYNVKQTADGGYILVGMTTAFGSAGEGWLVKTDALGVTTWSKAFHPLTGNSPSAWDYLYDVVETNGGYVAIGYAAMDTNMIQAWILKVNEAGNRIWENTFGGEYWDRLFSIKTTSDGGFVAAGDKHVTYNDTVYKHDGWLVKFNASGDTLWTKFFGGNNHDIFRSVIQTTNGGYIMSGERQVTESEGYRAWLVRTDENGNEIFNNVYHRGVFSAVVQADDLNFIAAGTTTSSNMGYEGYMIKTDQNGIEEWEYVLSATSMDDMFQSISKTNDGSYVLGGKYNSHMTGGDGWILKMNAETQLPVLYFFENFDSVATPELPEYWSKNVQVMLSNTAAEVKTMAMGVTPSQPNSAFIMNGIDGSNGQIDPTAFVALITRYVTVGPIGAKITFQANSGNAILVGTMSNPNDPSTFILHDSVPLTYNFTEYTVYFFTPGNTYIALKHANTNSVTPIFLDEIEFEQLVNVGLEKQNPAEIKVYPNPARNTITIESEKNMVNAQLYTLRGELVYTNNLNTNSLNINISEQNSSSLLLKIIFQDGSISSKIITVLP